MTWPPNDPYGSPADDQRHRPLTGPTEGAPWMGGPPPIPSYAPPPPGPAPGPQDLFPQHGYGAPRPPQQFRYADWGERVGVGKTMVSSSMIDRVTADLGRRLDEVPVGFKFFVDGLLDGSLGFGGEESAGASFLRRDGTVWTTDKDGILLALLASEIVAVTGKSPSALYRELTERFGDPVYERVDAVATKAFDCALTETVVGLVLASVAGT